MKRLLFILGIVVLLGTINIGHVKAQWVSSVAEEERLESIRIQEWLKAAKYVQLMYQRSIVRSTYNPQRQIVSSGMTDSPPPPPVIITVVNCPPFLKAGK